MKGKALLESLPWLHFSFREARGQVWETKYTQITSGGWQASSKEFFKTDRMNVYGIFRYLHVG